MTLDDADAVRRFISRMKGEADQSDLNTATSSSTTQYDGPGNQHNPNSDPVSNKHTNEYDGAKTPPNAAVAGPDSFHWASPEAQPKPSPHFSGLRAPDNTPKTAASSPRLSAANTYNEDVAEAFSVYVNTAISHPLSESMWAPGSARYKPSTLSGARSANILTSVKAVDPNPAINDTFARMSFKAADPDHKMGEYLMGEHITRSTSSRPPPSITNQLSGLASKTQGADVDDVVQTKIEKASDEESKPPAPTEIANNVQRVVGKENDATSTPKANLPPHLRVTRVSSQNHIKSDTQVPSSEELGSDVTGKVVDPGSTKESRAATKGDETKVTTGPTGTKPLTEPSSEKEDLENKTIFKAWPAQKERSRPQAKVRTAIIKDLPRDSTATFVASIVYGGPVEEIHIRSSATGHLSAVVRFMNAEDCKSFYEETSNGLVYRKDGQGRELVLFVELAKDVDVVGGLLQGWIDSGITRCVRAVGVESKWDLDGLLKIAERKNRKVEKIVDGQNAGGARSIVFRFCRVEDAVHFKAALSRDEDWEQCNIHYAADPCASASGVHLEL